MTHQFDVEIAMTYGIEEAIIINNLQFWIRKNRANEKNSFDGRTWTYNSRKAMVDLFPYMSESKIRRIMESLVEKGILVTGNYNKSSYDRTLWYAFNDESKWQIEPLHLSKSANGNDDLARPIPDIKPDGKQYNTNTTADDFISTLEPVQAERIATANAVACVSKLLPNPKQKTKTLEEHEIFGAIWEQTIKDHGLELGPKSGREGKACWQLVDLARKQFGLDAIAGVSSIITSLLTKKRQDRSQGGFWRDKSPLPSVVLANWHTLLETLREKTVSKDMQDAIDEVGNLF
jgi:hypothetical protein